MFYGQGADSEREALEAQPKPKNDANVTILLVLVAFLLVLLIAVITLLSGGKEPEQQAGPQRNAVHLLGTKDFTYGVLLQELAVLDEVQLHAVLDKITAAQQRNPVDPELYEQKAFVVMALTKFDGEKGLNNWERVNTHLLEAIEQWDAIDNDRKNPFIVNRIRTLHRYRGDALIKQGKQQEADEAFKLAGLEKALIAPADPKDFKLGLPVEK